jgi:transcriptional regulator with XRE-family HTH domain
MSKGLLAAKIGSLRKSKGLSQEELADYSSINLRTLQRIESGKTEPRGQTLRMIAKALDTPVEDFLDFTKEEDTGFLQVMNLATLSFWVIPLGNLFVPLVLWIMKRDKVKGVNELGRRIINFQITWSCITYGFAFISMISVFSGLPFAISPLLALPIILALCLVNSLIILMATFQLRRGNKNIYSIAFPILH